MATPVQLDVPDATAVTVAGNLAAGELVVSAARSGKPDQSYRFTHTTELTAVFALSSGLSGLSGLSGVVSAGDAPVTPPAANAVYRFDGDATNATGDTDFDLAMNSEDYFGTPKLGSGSLYSGSGQTNEPVLTGPVASTPFSIAVWFNLDEAFPTSPDAQAGDIRIGGGTVGLIILGSGGLPTANVLIAHTVGGYSSDVPCGAATGGWHHVVLTWNTTSVKVYFDGSEIASQTPAGVGSGTLDDGLTVSTLADWNTPIDDLSIVPAALTAEQVAYLWNAGAGRVYPV